MGENEVKEVTTQFVLNVAAAPSTKMTADVVQQNQNFRGIESGKLFTYVTGTSTGTPYVLKMSYPTADYKEYDLGFFFPSGGLDNTTTVDTEPETPVSHNHNQEESSNRVLQLSIPVNTDAVLFYGKAIKSSGVKDEDYGATNTDATVISAFPGQTVIAAKKILNESNVNQYDATARLMIAVINHLLRCETTEDGSVTVGTGDGSHTFEHLPAISWSQLGHQYELDAFPSETRYQNTQANIDAGVILGRPLQGLEIVMGRCYYLFTYIRPSDNTNTPGSEAWKAAIEAGTSIRPNGEYRAGSSTAVKSMIIDMYKVITAANTAQPTTELEANAVRLAEVILDRALLYFNGNNGEYRAISTVRELLLQYGVTTTTEWASLYAGAMDLNKYPYENFGVPEGAAQLGFRVCGTNIPEGQPGYIEQGQEGYPAKYKKDEFYYYHPNKPLVNPTMTEFEPKKYLYPAELWYYVNSPIRTTSSDITIDSYPNGVIPWSTSTWTDWDFPGKVSSSTRGVAVVNNIHYGVALLKSSVLYNDGVTVLQDNRSAFNDGEENKTINISSAQLQLRGILIGGVNPRMNWQFTRKYETSGDHDGHGSDLSIFDGVIYDHSLPSNTIPTASPNYTLVYDNYNSSETEENQNDVYVSLEFVNGGEAFWGRDNLIPSGGVFYLVAKLPKPTADQITDLRKSWPTDHQIPPIYGVGTETVPSGKVAGESKQIPRVFIQDFVTTAVFKIGATSLQKAYYSIPDLRASQMSLGLSVDLQWTPGLEYEIVL